MSHTDTSQLPSLADRMAAVREAADPSPRSADSSATPVEALLYIYIKATARGCIDYEAQFRVLYNWLKPFSLPSTSVESKHHFLTTTNLMRYMAGYLSISVGRLQQILKSIVYPMLGDSYEY